MKVEHRMTRDCVAVAASATLDEAVRWMAALDCGALPVVGDGRQVLGMVTDRDVCLLAQSRGRRLVELCVVDAMSRDVVACAPDDDVRTAQNLMRDAQVRRLPVVDADGMLVGVITLGQIARAGIERGDVSHASVGETLAAISRPRAASRA